MRERQPVQLDQVDQRSGAARRQTARAALERSEAPAAGFRTSEMTASLSAGASMGRLDDALVQFRMLTGASRPAVQLHGGGTKGDEADVHAHASAGLSGGGGRMPHLDTIQKAFGAHDVSGVQAHVGGPAAEACDALGATAYATGANVAFKSSPSLHTAAHEAAHVVQQKAGVSLKGGVGQVGDAYERHADAVADAVVAGRNVESMLGPVTGGGATGAVQRSVQLKGGEDLVAHLKGKRMAPMDLADGKKGYYLEAGSMARSPETEALAQKFEDRLGRKAVGDATATAAAATLAGEVEKIVDGWARSLEGAAGTADECLARLVGTDDKTVAGAVGNAANDIRTAIRVGNLREQMTVLFNFGKSFGKEVAAARNGKDNLPRIDDFIQNLDYRAAELKQKVRRMRGSNTRLVSDSKKGEVGKQKNTRGENGAKQNWTSRRTAGEATGHGVDLSPREVANMKLGAAGDPNIDAEVLTWQEGNRKWLMNEANRWVIKVRKANLPLKAGPSGTTDRIMQLRQMLAVSRPIATRAACIGYLLPIHAHSLIEILEAASQHGCPAPEYGLAVYKKIEPFTGLEAIAPTRDFWTAVKNA